jgi:hypothetical protein
MTETTIEKTECKKHRWIPLLGVNRKKTVPTSLFTCLKCGDLRVGRQTIKISRFRLDMGELPINSVAGINLMNPPTTANTASGLIIKAYITTNSQGVGAPLYVNSSGNLIEADAITSGTSPCVALAIDSGVGADKRILVHGILRVSTWAWTTGPGTASLIYIDTSATAGSAGKLTQIRPFGANEVTQPVGWALSATSMYFAPSTIYLTHT